MDPKQTIQAFDDAINCQDWSRLVGFLRRNYETIPRRAGSNAEGEKVAVRHHFRGTQHGAMGSYLPTGKTMNAEYITIYRVRNGQILEAWDEWDNLAGLRQLGHL
jgi:predicted ester cyclase